MPRLKLYFMTCYLSVFFMGDVAAQNLPSDIVTSFEKKFGVHHGKRRNHTKGICFTGFFKGTNPYHPIAKTSDIFNGNIYPVIGRFSHSGGNLTVSDTKHNGYGLAFQILLPDDNKHNITMNNIPFFPVPTPQAFLDLQTITTPNKVTGKINNNEVTAFKILFPELRRFSNAKSKNKAAGYNHVKYNSINTFIANDALGFDVPIRWEFMPQDLEKNVTQDELSLLDENYLVNNLKERIKQGHIVWNMDIIFANNTYPINNPTIPWTDNKKTSIAKLEITHIDESHDAKCKMINFDPLRLAGNIKPSNDPILLMRSPTYAISFAKRFSEN